MNFRILRTQSQKETRQENLTDSTTDLVVDGTPFPIPTFCFVRRLDVLYSCPVCQRLNVTKVNPKKLKYYPNSPTLWFHLVHRQGDPDSTIVRTSLPTGVVHQDSLSPHSETSKFSYQLTNAPFLTLLTFQFKSDPYSGEDDVRPTGVSVSILLFLSPSSEVATDEP